MANVNFLSGTKANWDALQTKDAYTFYLVDNSGAKELYLGTEKLTSQDELDAALTRLDGAENVTNSIRNIVKGYIEGLDTVSDVPIASVSNDVVTIKAGLTEVDGIIANNSGTDIVLSEIAVTGAAEDVSYDNTTSGMTATDVQAALDELAEASAGGVDSKTVYITETAGSSSDPYSKRYGIYQGATGSSSSPVVGEKLTDIDIPKDMVVEEGAVVDITFSENKLWEGSTDVTVAIKGEGVTPTAADAGKYIKLIIANATSDKLYIAAKDLVDIYEGGSTAEVTISIDNNNVITASIVDIAASKITYIEADAEHSIARESVGAALARLDGSDSTTGSVAKKVKDAIGALDAVADGTKTAIDGDTPRTKTNDDAVFALQSLTEADGKLSAMGVVEVAQIGTGTGRSGSGTELDPYVYDDTIVGAKKLAEDLFDEAEAAVEDLDVSEFALAEKNSSTDIITIHGLSQSDGLIAGGVNAGNDISFAAVAANGEAASVSIADAGSYTTATNVEDALQDVYARLTWGSFPSSGS